MKDLVMTFYDAQQKRISTGNRIIAGYKRTNPDVSDKILVELKEQYNTIAAGAVREKDIRIAMDYTTFALIEAFVANETTEKQLGERIEKEVKRTRLWKEYLKEIKGCGPTMAAVILSEIDITKCNYPSSLRRYCGLDVGPDNKARNRTKDHLVDRDYVAKDGAVKQKKSITYNPFLQTKLIGVLGDCLIRANGHYKKVYDESKHRYTQVVETPLHAHNRARRRMVSIFVSDLWYAWRTIEGLPLAEEYHRAKLGIKHEHGKHEWI